MLTCESGECGAAVRDLTVLEETATVRERAHHDFAFAAESGVRYEVEVRVAEPDYQHPCIAVEVMSDGSNVECTLPAAVPFGPLYFAHGSWPSCRHESP